MFLSVCLWIRWAALFHYCSWNSFSHVQSIQLSLIINSPEQNKEDLQWITWAWTQSRQQGTGEDTRIIVVENYVLLWTHYSVVELKTLFCRPSLTSMCFTTCEVCWWSGTARGAEWASVCQRPLQQQPGRSSVLQHQSSSAPQTLRGSYWVRCCQVSQSQSSPAVSISSHSNISITHTDSFLLHVPALLLHFHHSWDSMGMT